MSKTGPVMRPVIVIAGPTASGKSAIAMHLAQLTNIEIVCADARTIYRGLDIGTAKPSKQDQIAVRHHCIDIIEPSDAFSARDFALGARRAIESIAQHSIPVIVGGSGFYIQALIDGLSSEGADVDPQVREEIQKEFDTLGRDVMYERLVDVDPPAARLYADKNPRRIQRALEYHRATGNRLSDTWNAPRDAASYEAIFLARELDNVTLRKRIEDRCHAMWNVGLLHETQLLLESGLEETSQSMQTVGYKQALDVLAGRMSLQAAQQDMIHATWQYAKRQRTWLRKDQRYRWISGTEQECALDILQQHQTRNSADGI
ncbi:MAG: tRNA (adenosine(37)-N6)-dimethylallyltransferase MiaA [Ignavibacteria bacterium]|jgi:tRNA dimethylallyltransferase